MRHRHLAHEDLTAAAIDDVIARGGRADWVRLRDAMRVDASVTDRVRRVCEPQRNDPSAQRHHLWNRYAATRGSLRAAESAFKCDDRVSQAF